MATETRTIQDGKRTIYIQKYQIASTRLFVHQALEPVVWKGVAPDHSTVSRIEGVDGYVGTISSRALPADLEALAPRSTERATAVQQWHTDCYEESYGFILQAFPELMDTAYRANGGEITTEEEA